jgi:hypothetical protein
MQLMDDQSAQGWSAGNVMMVSGWQSNVSLKNGIASLLEGFYSGLFESYSNNMGLGKQWILIKRHH